eukprot:GHVU01010049.1.p1 GENE.GHVU01010049.1~~GHVU01010049.1.p1  ORF type:complete len:233 (-),score=46.27 GHVU01010049.1:512-1210(-)
MSRQIMSLGEAMERPPTDANIRKVIRGACTKLDSRVATELPSSKDGSTAIIIVLHKLHVYAANLGDSSACLCRSNGENVDAIPLAEAHKPWVIKEKDRILKAGGTVENGRVNGRLEVSRSFGDIPLKKYGVLCTPTLMKFTVDLTKDEFILLGCDGFWSCWTNLEVVKLAREYIDQELRRCSIHEAEPTYFQAREVCKKLVDYVIVEKKAQDNVSCLLVRISTKSSGASMVM